MTTALGGGLGAILLAGGRATRVGGAVKPLFEVGGRTLLHHAVDAATAAGARPLTVVSPVLDASLSATWLAEDPPFSGPAAAVVTALGSWSVDDPEWTLLLACDLPRVDAAVPLLLAGFPRAAEEDGACLVDGSGRRQWLLGVYRTAALRAAAIALPSGARDLPLRSLLGSLALRSIPAPDDLSRDVDTWEDLSEARRNAAPHASPALSKESP